MGHILANQSHLSIAILGRLLLAMVMEIWHRDCGPFGRHFAVFAILGKVQMTISPWGKESSQERSSASCSTLPRVNSPRLSYYATYDASHVAQFCISCCFLPRRVAIPSGNSKKST